MEIFPLEGPWVIDQEDVFLGLHITDRLNTDFLVLLIKDDSNFLS